MHYYPLSQFKTQKTLLELNYGNPNESYSNGNSIYVWNTDNGLTVSLMEKYNSFSKTNVISITYAYDKYKDVIMLLSQKMQSGMIKMEYVKMQE